MSRGDDTASGSDTAPDGGDTAPGDTADLAADYVRAGFSTTLGWGASPALVIVDMCRAYVDPESPLYAATAPDAYRVAGRLAATARAAGRPVAFTRVEYDESGANGGLFFRKVPALGSFVTGNPLAEFTDLVAPADGDIVVTKQYPSAFFGTSLLDDLRGRGIDTVVVCGVSTSGCVRATALDALQNGFAPMVVAQGCADRDPRPHHANLFDLAAKYADVVDEDEAARHLSRPREDGQR